MIYLDNAATTYPKPQTVLQAVSRFHSDIGANPGRSGHRLSLSAARIIEQCRVNLCRLFGTNDPSRFIFTLNATDALNMAISSILTPGSHVITSTIDHNSVIRPLHALASQGHINLTTVTASRTGTVTPDAIAAAITPETRLVALAHASNVTGAINPIHDITDLLRSHQITFLLDAAQTSGVVPIDLQQCPIDLLAASGHKGLLGPQGTGILYVRPGLEIQPFRRGGTGNQSHSPQHPVTMPERLEAGTPNTPGIAGLSAGIEYILDVGIASIRNHEQRLLSLLIEKLRRINRVRLYGPLNPELSTCVLSITTDDLDPADVADKLDATYQIMVRPGLHCAPGAHRTLGTYPTGTIRLSPGLFTTTDEINEVCTAIKTICREG